MDENDWYEVDVITCAAHNQREESLSEKELFNLNYYRIKQILGSAIDNNVDNIILGAFGCGAFSNDPKVISSVFKRILIDEEYFKYFVNVHFAIFCANIETGNFIEFKNVFHDYLIEIEDNEIKNEKNEKINKTKDDLKEKSKEEKKEEKKENKEKSKEEKKEENKEKSKEEKKDNKEKPKESDLKKDKPKEEKKDNKEKPKEEKKEEKKENKEKPKEEKKEEKKDKTKEEKKEKKDNKEKKDKEKKDK